MRLLLVLHLCLSLQDVSHLEGSGTHLLFLLQVGKLRRREIFSHVPTSFGADLGQNKDVMDQDVHPR